MHWILPNRHPFQLWCMAQYFCPVKFFTFSGIIKFLYIQIHWIKSCWFFFHRTVFGACFYLKELNIPSTINVDQQFKLSRYILHWVTIILILHNTYIHIQWSRTGRMNFFFFLIGNCLVKRNICFYHLFHFFLLQIFFIDTKNYGKPYGTYKLLFTRHFLLERKRSLYVPYSFP